MRILLPWAAALVAAVWLAWPSGPGAGRDAPPERLVLTGSSTIAPLAAEIAQRFERLHPGLRVDVQAGGSSRGIHDLRTGLADVGLVSRALHADERDLRAHLVALDGIAVIVHAGNPVTGLTHAQIAGIYTGRIADWREVGGRAGPITIVHKAEGHSTLELFLDHFGLDRTQVHPDVVAGHNQQVIKTVAGNPQAIGYVSIGAAAHEAQRGVPIRLLALDGVAPTTAEVAAGRYPLVRPLNLVTGAAPDGRARRFIEFARTPRVDDLVTALQFVVPAR